MSSKKSPVIKQGVGFPVYALQWQNDTTIVASGGGGIGKSGVRNKIIVSKVEEPVQDDDGEGKPKLEIVSEFLLASDEDAPMTLAVTSKGTIVTGINQSESTVSSKNQNKHLRIFELTGTKILLKQQKEIFPPSTPFNPDDYQRQSKFSPTTNLLAISSTSGSLSILSFPSLESIYSTKADGDIYSLDFSPADNDTIAYITSKTLEIIPFRDSKRIRLQNKKIFNELSVVASEPATFHPSKTAMSYRCLQFISPTKLLCAINDRTTKSAYFGIYILNLEKGWREVMRKLPSRIRGVTSMDVSHSRRMIAVASSDMAVNIFHMDTFATLLTVERVAEFAVTQVSFNSEGTYLACSSVANSISLIHLDEDVGKPGRIRMMIMEKNLYFFIAIIVFMLAIVWMSLYKK